MTGAMAMTVHIEGARHWKPNSAGFTAPGLGIEVSKKEKPANVEYYKQSQGLFELAQNPKRDSLRILADDGSMSLTANTFFLSLSR